MKMLTITLLTFCIISSTLASVGFGPAEIHESHPNMCYESEGGKYYNPGESWQLTGCGLGTCSFINHTGTPALMVSYETCGVVAADPPCYTTEDLSLPYPHCCPQIVCPEVEEIETEHKEGQESVDRMPEKEIQKSIVSEKEVENEPDLDYLERVAKDMQREMSEDLQKYYYTFDGVNHDPFTAWNEFDDSVNIIPSNDLGHFDHSDSDLKNFDPARESAMLKELKVSPRFLYMEQLVPKIFLI